jgi:hypothetical protein
VAITLTREEKAQLEKENTLIRDLPGANGADRASYHNPVTGQEMTGPMDPYHMTRRIRQGWRLGPAPKELQEKWLVRQQELKEADDLIVEEHKNSDEGRQEREVWEQNFSDAVATAVTKVLERLGVDIPNAEGNRIPRQEEEETTEVDHQTDFLQAVDAPTESDTKLNVSPASRPNLRLVE